MDPRSADDAGGRGTAPHSIARPLVASTPPGALHGSGVERGDSSSTVTPTSIGAPMAAWPTMGVHDNAGLRYQAGPEPNPMAAELNPDGETQEPRARDGVATGVVSPNESWSTTKSTAREAHPLIRPDPLAQFTNLAEEGNLSKSSSVESDKHDAGLGALLMGQVPPKSPEKQPKQPQAQRMSTRQQSKTQLTSSTESSPSGQMFKRGLNLESIPASAIGSPTEGSGDEMMTDTARAKVEHERNLQSILATIMNMEAKQEAMHKTTPSPVLAPLQHLDVPEPKDGEDPMEHSLKSKQALSIFQSYTRKARTTGVGAIAKRAALQQKLPPPWYLVLALLMPPVLFIVLLVGVPVTADPLVLAPPTSAAQFDWAFLFLYGGVLGLCMGATMSQVGFNFFTVVHHRPIVGAINYFLCVALMGLLYGTVGRFTYSVLLWQTLPIIIVGLSVGLSLRWGQTRFRQSYFFNWMVASSLFLIPIVFGVICLAIITPVRTLGAIMTVVAMRLYWALYLLLRFVVRRLLEVLACADVSSMMRNEFSLLVSSMCMELAGEMFLNLLVSTMRNIDLLWARYLTIALDLAMPCLYCFVMSDLYWRMRNSKYNFLRRFLNSDFIELHRRNTVLLFGLSCLARLYAQVFFLIFMPLLTVGTNRFLLPVTAWGTAVDDGMIYVAASLGVSVISMAVTRAYLLQRFKFDPFRLTLHLMRKHALLVGWVVGLTYAMVGVLILSAEAILAGQR